MELLERVQRRHQDDQRDGEALLGGKERELGLFSLEKRNFYLIVAFQCLKGAYRKDGERFPRAWSDRTRRNGFALTERRFGLDVRKKSFPVRVVRPWHRLPREAVAAPSLEVSKTRLDGAWSNLG
ncbi:hypothetical protein BTVI_16489 [Pitangus sulphuratus]|nr:hypothetical protein BTVI_16489 [Pitangus sulphuratus]